jgi:hypothetical protein
VRIRKPTRAPPPEQTRARDIARIMNPPKPTPLGRIRRWPWAAREWWSRHVTRRALHRQLDAARIILDRPGAAHPQERLQQLLDEARRGGPDSSSGARRR